MFGLPTNRENLPRIGKTFINKFMVKLRKDMCGMGSHKGDIVDIGPIAYVRKINRPPLQFKGKWRIRRCGRCGELYTTINDRIDESEKERSE